MSLLFDALFNSMAFGHFIVDMLNGQRAILLTYWSQQSGMSNTTLALVTTIYIWVASLSQPVFGWVADRFGKSRLLAAGGILWLVAFYSLALRLPMEWAIPCIILASLGSAAFHPVGTMQSTLRGRHLLAGRETTSTSWFFFFGQFGYFMGPIIGGPLLQQYGPGGIFILAVPALLIGINAAWRLKHPMSAPAREAQVNKERTPVARLGPWMIVALALVAALQSWAQQNINTFLPKYLSDLGQSPASYGLMTGLFMGGSGIGNVLGGALADRFGRKWVAALALALAGIPLYFISRVGWSPWLFLLVPLSGALTGAVHSIIVVLAQHVVRGSMALASGLTLGFMFSAGALGTLLSGPLADQWGFPPLFQATAVLVLVASLLTLTINERSSTSPAASLLQVEE